MLGKKKTTTLVFRVKYYIPSFHNKAKQNLNLISLALDSGTQRFFLFIIISINLIILTRLQYSLAAQNKKKTLFIPTEITLQYYKRGKVII